MRHGVGIEGFTHNEDQVPIAIVYCKDGRRMTFDRFDPDNKSHRNMLRRMCVSIDTAQKRARKALLLVDERAAGTSRTLYQTMRLLDHGDSKTRVGVEASRSIALMREKFDHDRVYMPGLSSPEERLENARRHYRNFRNVSKAFKTQESRAGRTGSNEDPSSAADTQSPSVTFKVHARP